MVSFPVLPFQEKIDQVLTNYLRDGRLDQLSAKWYGSMPCFRFSADMYKPQPLGIRAVAGVFIMLLVGMAVGAVILLWEFLTYKYTLKSLRAKKEESFWKSSNLMFFSQVIHSNHFTYMIRTLKNCSQTFGHTSHANSNATNNSKEKRFSTLSLKERMVKTNTKYSKQSIFKMAMM
jgi:ABC-type multidrug transport system fused ATPase/permease subunit